VAPSQLIARRAVQHPAVLEALVADLHLKDALAGLPEKSGDGMVSYSRAHIEDVESKLVVRSGHSAQPKPPSIEEVRRILLLHGEAR
jgi:hypothetical protein